MDDSVVNTIIDKVNELLDIENQLKDYAKKLKPLREDKKLIMEELTDLFIKNNLTTYEVNDRVISFHNRTIKKKINENVITDSIEKTFDNNMNIEDFTKSLLDIIYSHDNEEVIEELKITKKKVPRKTNNKKNKK